MQHYAVTHYYLVRILILALLITGVSYKETNLPIEGLFFTLMSVLFFYYFTCLPSVDYPVLIFFVPTLPSNSY